MRAALRRSVVFIFVGLTLLLHAAPASAQPSCEDLIVNGSFERPVIPDGSYRNRARIKGWWVSRGTEFELQRNLMGPAADGQQYLELASNAPITVKQRIATKRGETYQLRFSYSPRPGFRDNDVEVKWRDKVVTTLRGDGTGLSQTKWQEHSFLLKAYWSSVVLSFADMSTSDPAAAGFIDNVRLCQMPSENLSVTVSDTLNYECDREDSHRATAELLIQGGKPPYVCTGPAANFPQNAVSNRCSGSGVSVGHHTFTVTDADNGSAQATIDVEWVVQVEVVEVTPPCCGCENGSATVRVSGENPEFNYRWNDPMEQTTLTATGLASGTYRVSVTDAKGCREAKEVEIPSGC